MRVAERLPPTRPASFDPEACPKDAVDKIRDDGLTCKDLLRLNGAGLRLAVVAALSEGVDVTITCPRKIATGETCPYKARLANKVRGAGVTGDPADEIIEIKLENETCLRQAERESGVF